MVCSAGVHSTICKFKICCIWRMSQLSMFILMFMVLGGQCNSSWLLEWIQSLRGINQHWTVAQIEMDGAAQCSGLCKKVGGRIVFNKKTLCLHCWFLTHLTSVQKYTNALVFGIKLAVLYVFLIALTQDPIACFPARISLFCSISHFSLSQFESLQEWVWRPGAPL